MGLYKGMIEQGQFRILIEKYIDGTISPDEQAQLDVFSLSEGNKEHLDAWLFEYFSEDSILPEAVDLRAQVVQQNSWLGIQEKIGGKPISILHNFSLISKIAIAAGLILVLSFSFYFSKRFLALDRWSSISRSRSIDIKPGSNRATIIAADGTKYVLAEDKQEIVIDQGKVRYKNGELLTESQTNQQIVLATPRGGQYRVTLSDGTKVWLNAASSLTYPISFNGKERRVRLIGEAYFEVTHDVSHPFIVSTDDQQVKVLGTSFNLNAYQDEHKSVTTLLEGSVELTKDGASARLLPDEQSISIETGFQVAKVNAHIYSAWKDGEFRFNATPIIVVLHELERWYDLDIDYSGIPQDIAIHASIRKNKQLSTVLQALEKITGLKFEIKGRRLRLMK